VPARERDSPARQAGIVAGDIILALSGSNVTTLDDFYKRLWSSGAPGVEVTLKVLHGSDVKDVKIRSMDRMEHIRKRRRSSWRKLRHRPPLLRGMPSIAVIVNTSSGTGHSEEELEAIAGELHAAGWRRACSGRRAARTSPTSRGPRPRAPRGGRRGRRRRHDQRGRRGRARHADRPRSPSPRERATTSPRISESPSTGAKPSA
jgi:hypothetical protein